MKPGRVLVVDDDRDILSVFRELLESKGHTVETAETGEKALELALKNTFDVALVDIRLPDIAGTEVLRRMQGRTGGMKRIIVTGYPSLENAIESISHGVDAYLLKPVDPAQLLKIVQAKVEEKREEDMFIEKALAERMTALRLEFGLESNATPKKRANRRRSK